MKTSLARWSDFQRHSPPQASHCWRRQHREQGATALRPAQAIETLFQDKLTEHYSQLAYHYSRSGNVLKAVEYLHLAGKQALQRSAQFDAIEHLNAARNLLMTLPETPARRREELALLLTLGPAWMAARAMRHRR
ncbi:hypothetical protein AWV79_27045 [Cupriavidus sp. UYMMa02A]|nr:hypothetical protein AWV79_27045 [Cupriavidus sp. UYMMa02A]